MDGYIIQIRNGICIFFFLKKSVYKSIVIWSFNYVVCMKPFVNGEAWGAGVLQ